MYGLINQPLSGNPTSPKISEKWEKITIHSRIADAVWLTLRVFISEIDRTYDNKKFCRSAKRKLSRTLSKSPVWTERFAMDRHQ